MITDSKILDALDDLNNTTLLDDLPIEYIVTSLFALCVDGKLGERRDCVAPVMRGLVTRRGADLTESMRKVIHAIVLDENEDIERREACLALVLHTESCNPEGVFNQLSIEQRIELSGTWVRPMCKLAQTDHFPRYALNALIEATPDANRLAMIDKIEKCAHQVDTELEDEVSIHNLRAKYDAVIH